MSYCKCGCGETCQKNYKRGHISRINVPIGLDKRFFIEERNEKLKKAMKGKTPTRKVIEAARMYHLGRPRLESTKIKISNTLKGRKRSLEFRLKHVGNKNFNPNGWGKSFIREDLNQHFRSTWEANFARILNYLDIDWEYEKYRIFFEDCSYLPDFYLPWEK